MPAPTLQQSDGHTRFFRNPVVAADYQRLKRIARVFAYRPVSGPPYRVPVDDWANHLKWLGIAPRQCHSKRLGFFRADIVIVKPANLIGIGFKVPMNQWHPITFEPL